MTTGSGLRICSTAKEGLWMLVRIIVNSLGIHSVRSLEARNLFSWYMKIKLKFCTFVGTCVCACMYICLYT